MERIEEEQEVDTAEEVSYDSSLQKFASIFKKSNVPASKKKPILCDNVQTAYVEFNEEDFVKVYSSEGV